MVKILTQRPGNTVLILEPPLIPATLIKRYKRFLADVTLKDARVLTVHTPNTGAMLGLAEPGMRIWLRDTKNTKRKYRYSWEMSEPQAGNFVGVHTGLVNELVSEAITNGVVKELQGYSTIAQEVRYGAERSRIDLLLQQDGRRPCYVEIKNVTAKDDDGVAIFPDAITSRGQKHLRELMNVVQAGDRAVMCFCVQREDVTSFRPADEIDAQYGQLLRVAAGAGVEFYAYQAMVSPKKILLQQSIPIKIM